MKQNEKPSKLQEAVEAVSPQKAVLLIVEMLLEEDEITVDDIAADFIEDDVGHYDWVNNWKVVQSKGDPVSRVQAFLDRYGYIADAQSVVNAINRMVTENPGRWK